jgi:hypothetical protein
MFTHLSDSYHILSDIIPASRRRLEHFQVVCYLEYHLSEADMYDIVVRQLSLWVSGMLSFSLLLYFNSFLFYLNKNLKEPFLMFVVPLELCVKCYAFVFKSELFA